MAILIIIGSIGFASWALMFEPQGVVPPYPTPETTRLLDRGVSPEDLGYQDGCMSRKASRSIGSYHYEKDLFLYVNHERYREGWDAGFKECR